VLSQKKGRLPTITQVKVWSPEIMLPQEGEGFVVPEASIAVRVHGECISGVPGSEAMVGNRIVCAGTWESHIVPKEASNEPKRRRRKYDDMAVGLTHSRGVDGVMPIESPCSLEGVSGRT
jgi:hypothetical protein